jgi:hypothetical protein
LIYITASGSQPVTTAATGILVTVNAALTGTITLQAGSTTFAIITNPTVGSSFRYYGLRGQGAITANPSATCNITISLINRV